VTVRGDAKLLSQHVITIKMGWSCENREVSRNTGSVYNRRTC
jgi:hypothetical protein